MKQRDMIRATALLIALLTPMSVGASPWTLPKSKVLLFANTDYQFATREFLDVRRAQNFPLRGQLDASSFSLGARIGLTDSFELEVSLPFRVVSYRSDPVLLLPQPDGTDQSSLDYYQENIIDLSRTVSGVGDLRFVPRFRISRVPIAAAFEIGIKAPTGYRGPVGTFGDRPSSTQDFVDGIARYVSPENVQDDVTLGDGQLDISPRLLVGDGFSTGTFFRMGVGYDLRLGGAGDQLSADLKLGQVVHPRVLVFVSAQFVYALQTGRVIGVSVAAVDPDVPASEYGGVDNLLLREVTLDRDALDLSGGIIFRLTQALEINMGFQRTIWGRNTSQVNVVSMSAAFRTELLP